LANTLPGLGVMPPACAALLRNGRPVQSGQIDRLVGERGPPRWYLPTNNNTSLSRAAEDMPPAFVTAIPELHVLLNVAKSRLRGWA
jgi:hypothetical protein